jgi:trehalose/maltose hydrolase-like predicted phosphorylase
MTNSWTVTEDAFDPNQLHHKETIFTIGNGYLSTRGAFEEGYPDDRRATFVHGVFDDVPIAFTELANAPDWLPITVFLNGERFSLSSGTVESFHRALDLRTGVLTRTVKWTAPNGCSATLTFERFASLADEHLLCMRCQVMPEFDGEVEIRAALNGNMDNEGFLHWRWMDQAMHVFEQNQKVVHLHTRTRKSQIDLALAMRLICPPSARLEYWDVQNAPTFRAAFEVRKNEPVSVTKLVGIATSRDDNDPVSLASAHVVKPVSWDEALESQKQAWGPEWERADVVIEGDEEAQLAVRFSLFQLLIAAPRHDNRVNLGAKTLSGFGYRGHAFWDTEIFMLPVFTFTSPHIARNLLDYRYLTLNAARAKAKASGYEGAWFAWESAATGEEVTPTWVPDARDKKRLARVWTGDLAIHISADVAYGAYQYWRVTGDEEWFAQRGAEIILDTAKFFASRAEWRPDEGCYAYSDVIGPDEYHDHVSNNAYTNRMAQWNLETALETLNWLKQNHPERAAELTRSLDLREERLAKWREVSQKICLRVQPGGLIEQFDGFFKLTDVNLDDYEPRTKSMQEIFGVEGANHYQSIKQPDVIMLLYLLQNEYSLDAVRANYDYYTPRTDHTHGSSLGPSIQAIVACRMGAEEEAYKHFIRTARADLRDVRGNAGDGIHGASAGGIWQAVVFGFAGLQLTDSSWKINPRLPGRWKRIAFHFYQRGKLQTVDIRRDP